MVATELRMMTPDLIGLLVQVELAPSKCWSSHKRSKTSTPRMPYLSNSLLLMCAGGGGDIKTGPAHECQRTQSGSLHLIHRCTPRDI